MSWSTLEKIEADTGVSKHRIVAAVRSGEEINGFKFEVDKAVKPPLFRVVGDVVESPKSEVESPKSEVESPKTLDPIIEHALKASEEQALQAAGIELADVPGYLGEVTRGMAVKKLQEIPGIGPVGASRIVDYAKTLGWVALVQPVPEMPYEVPEYEAVAEQVSAALPESKVSTDEVRGVVEIPQEVEDLKDLEHVEKTITKRTVLPHQQRHHPMLPSCKVVGRAEHGSDSWMSLRAKGIGSSDAGAVLGLSPYADPHDVWSTKVGVDTPRKPWLEPYAWFGNFFEPYVLFEIGCLPGAELGTLQSQTWPFALANIDGLDQTEGIIEEIKTTSEKWDSIPHHYYAQVQHQMAVTGLDTARIRQFICPVPRKHLEELIDRIEPLCFMRSEAENIVCDWLWSVGELVTWVVPYDEDFVERMMEREADLWAYCESGEEPPVFEPEGEVDLSDEAELYAALQAYADVERSIDKDAVKTADKLKKSAREVLIKTVALLGEPPKKVLCGPHSATFVNRHGGYWQIRGGDDGIDF